MVQNIEDYRCLGTLEDQDLKRAEQTKVCLKLATLKYDVCEDKYVITKIKNNSGEEIIVRIVNNLKEASFNSENCCDEGIIRELSKYVDDKYIFKLSDGLKEYRKSQQINFEKQYFVKLFKVEKNDDYIERENVGRGWIDYVKQIRKQLFHIRKYIFDTNNEYGIWVAKENCAESLLNSEGAQEHYGKNYAFILKTVDNIFYVSDEKEVVGDKFKVIGILEREDLLNMLKKYKSIDEILKHEKIKRKSWKTMLKIIFERNKNI